MARKQTRRTVSLRQYTYNQALWHANVRGLSLAQLVTHALATVGVDVGPQAPMTTEDRERAIVSKALVQRKRRAA